MTLRLRYHLALLPLFLGLALGSVSLFYVMQRDEISWGLAEESRSRALFLATFLGVRTDRESFDSEAGRQRALAQLAETTGGANLQWFVLEKSGWRARPLFESPGLEAPAAPTPSIIEQLRLGRPVARHLRRPTEASDVSIGYAAVEDERGVIRAVVGVATVDTVTRAELRHVRDTSLRFLAIVMAAGFVIAEALTRRARADIERLAAGARALARGDYTHRWRGSAIRELDDLSSTLGSISRILRDGVDRTRRRFLRAEQMPGEEEIAAAYRQRCLTANAPAPAVDVPCAIRRVGHTGCEDFWGVRRTATGWHLVAGRLQPAEEQMPMLQRIVRAEAARDYLLGLLSDRPPAEAWQELDAVFKAADGESASVSLADRAAVTAAHGPARVRATPHAAAPNLVGSLAPATMDFAREYLRQFPRRPIDALADELAALLADRDNGIIIVFPPCPPAL
jgi:HAMP domain-containing protein